MLWVLKEGGIMEAKGITCKIPLDLHERISEEMRESGRTVSQYMEMIIREQNKNHGISGQRGVVPENQGASCPV